jgi:TPR repeat protein
MGADRTLRMLAAAGMTWRLPARVNIRAGRGTLHAPNKRNVEIEPAMSMVFRRFIGAVLLAGASIALVAAGPLEDGLDAYREGDFLKALHLWRPLAESGNGPAQYRLGLLYAEGKGVAPDDAEAARWFERAAEQGDAAAQYNLGVSYSEAIGVRKDNVAAAKWFRRAADQGMAYAQLNLGLLYASGVGVPSDNVEAMKWIDLAIYALPPGGARSDAARALGDIVSKMTAEQIQEAKSRERAWKVQAEAKPAGKDVP